MKNRTALLRTRTMRALGLDFRIESDSEGLVRHAERVFHALPDGADPALVVRWVTDPPGSQTVRVVVGDALAVVNGRSTHSFAMLLWHLNRAVVDSSAQRWLLLHGAAARRGASMVVLTAPSESGKSTTVAGLVQEGWDYVTDEMVAIDRTSGVVTPYPRPLCLDPGSWPVLTGLNHQPTSFEGGQWHVPPRRVASCGVPTVIAFPRYRSGGVTRLAAVRRAEAVRLLVEGTFEFLDEPALNLAALAQLARGARCFRLDIGNLSEAVELLGALVTGAPQLDEQLDEPAESRTRA